MVIVTDKLVSIGNKTSASSFIYQCFVGLFPTHLVSRFGFFNIQEMFL